MIKVISGKEEADVNIDIQQLRRETEAYVRKGAVSQAINNLSERAREIERAENLAKSGIKKLDDKLADPRVTFRREVFESERDDLEKELVALESMDATIGQMVREVNYSERHLPGAAKSVPAAGGWTIAKNEPQPGPAQLKPSRWHAEPSPKENIEAAKNKIRTMWKRIDDTNAENSEILKKSHEDYLKYAKERKEFDEKHGGVIPHAPMTSLVDFGRPSQIPKPSTPKSNTIFSRIFGKVTATFGKPEKNQQSQPQKPRDKMAKVEEFVCPTCGSGLRRNATECYECGEKFEEDYFICPTCDAKISPQSKKCPACGEIFEEENLSQFDTKVEEFVCPTCDAKVKSGDTKCPKCGEDFVIGEVEGYQCPYCSALLGDNDTKCPKCGENFAEDEPPVKSEPKFKDAKGLIGSIINKQKTPPSTAPPMTVPPSRVPPRTIPSSAIPPRILPPRALPPPPRILPPGVQQLAFHLRPDEVELICDNPSCPGGDEDFEIGNEQICPFCKQRLKSAIKS